MNDGQDQDHPQGFAPTEKQSVERVDTQIGPYRLLEPLGHGAMGEVWRAEQREPVKRIVALKLILKGMDTREVITRFEIERQAMALMNHPWIAKVLDAGETDNGRPWIAMEYVAGEKITDYCHRNELSIDDRLKLFQKVCKAVQHAHQNAVIHRDLKPGNILVVEVDGEPVPKIIDFGIAKATAQRLSDRSAATFMGQLIGTPLYMSPEQVEMSAAGVDTRADVYSLGVVLYELLVGALPYDPEVLARAALNEVLKVLKEGEPPRPSTRVSTLGDKTAEVAARRKLNPSKLVGKLRGDLDWIVLKSLDKDRKRRYGTPQDFADDIERYLEHDVVGARPPSVVYRLSRFVRKNRITVGVATAAVLVLAAFGIWQAYQNGIIARERDRAMANERLSLARAQLKTDPTVALAHAMSSLEILDQPTARRVAIEAVTRGPLRDEFPGEDVHGNPLSVDVTPDGRLLIASTSQTEEPSVYVYDLVTRTRRTLSSETGGFTWRVQLSRNGSYAGAIALDGLHVWRVSDGVRVVYHPGDWRSISMGLTRADDPTGFMLSESERDGRTRWYLVDPLAPSVDLMGESMGTWGSNEDGHTPSYAGGTRVLDYDEQHVFLQELEDFGTERIQTVGYMESTVAAVALDPHGAFAVAVDHGGEFRVWDLREDPVVLYREFREEPDEFYLKFDPYRPRFLSVWGAESSTLYDLASSPPRAPLVLEDRSHWTHDGAFLPDGSIITSRNGILLGELSFWKRQDPRAWVFDWGDSLGGSRHTLSSSDETGLFVWATNGKLVHVPLESPGQSVPRTIATTIPWPSGIYSGFHVDGSDRRALAFSMSHGGISVVELETGEVRTLDVLEQTVKDLALSESGRLAAFADVPDEGGYMGPIRIVDLDIGRLVTTLGEGAPPIARARFEDDQSLTCVFLDHVATLRIDDSEAAPDTLWVGDPSRGARFLKDGRELLVQRGDFTLVLVDLDNGTVRELGSEPRAQLRSATYSPDESLLALALGRAGIRVIGMDSGNSWRIPALSSERDQASVVLFDRSQRWLISDLGQEGAWNLPLDPIFKDLDADEFLDICREKTNVRMVPDVDAETGYRITNLWMLQPE